MRGIVVVMVVVGGLGRRAVARPADDGCPSFGKKDHTAFGVEVRPDTSLARSRLGFLARATHSETPEVIDHALQAKGYFAYSTSNDSAHGFTVFGSYEKSEERWGNFNGLVGYRNSKLMIADAVRVGWAVRLGTGVGLYERRIGIANQLAAQLPFDVAGQAHERPVTLSAEGRFEMVGCTGGFAYVRFDNVTWHGAVDDSRRRFDTMDFSVAVGGYPNKYLGVALDVGAQWGVTNDKVIPDRITRVGAILEGAAHEHFSIVLHVGALSGSVVGGDASLRLVVRR